MQSADPLMCMRGPSLTAGPSPLKHPPGYKAGPSSIKSGPSVLIRTITGFDLQIAEGLARCEERHASAAPAAHGGGDPRLPVPGPAGRPCRESGNASTLLMLDRD